MVTIVSLVVVVVAASGGSVAVAKGIAIGGAFVLGGVTITEFAKKSKASKKERSTETKL